MPQETIAKPGVIRGVLKGIYAQSMMSTMTSLVIGEENDGSIHKTDKLVLGDWRTVRNACESIGRGNRVVVTIREPWDWDVAPEDDPDVRLPGCK